MRIIVLRSLLVMIISLRIQTIILGYMDRAYAYGESGQYALAEADYAKAIELKPDYSLAHSNRGWANLKLGNYDKALVSLNKAIELDPENNYGYRNGVKFFST